MTVTLPGVHVFPVYRTAVCKYKTKYNVHYVPPMLFSWKVTNETYPFLLTLWLFVQRSFKNKEISRFFGKMFKKLSTHFCAICCSNIFRGPFRKEFHFRKHWTTLLKLQTFYVKHWRPCPKGRPWLTVPNAYLNQRKPTTFIWYNVRSHTYYLSIKILLFTPS